MNKTTTKTIGELIREARESQGISQSDLAAAVKITRQAMSQIESGANSPAFSTLDAIARFLELSVSLVASGRKSANSRRNS